MSPSSFIVAMSRGTQHFLGVLVMWAILIWAMCCVVIGVTGWVRGWWRRRK